MLARISEIFLSYQGEGPFVGSRQLFVRVYSCNLNCGYCDTKPDSYRSFGREALLSKVLDFDDEYNEITLTGGEPLIYGDFLTGFLTLYRKHRKHPVFLETNGTLAGELVKVLGEIDKISMDFKLPSSDPGCGENWDEHKRFIEIAKEKDLIVKTVITDTTSMDDIKKMAKILSGVDKDMTVVLQPVTPAGAHAKGADDEMVTYFKEYVQKTAGKQVLVMGQVHKLLGIK